MIGRAQELAHLESLVDSTSSGGHALVIEAEAGVGKSALLTEGARLAAAAGFRTLGCTGIEGGGISGFECLHELLHPVLDRVESLLPQQQGALLSAFGLAQGPVPDPTTIGLAALTLLEEVAGEQPLLVVVEDVQWLDPSTSTAIGYVGRRLEHAPILMLAACRVGAHASPPAVCLALPRWRLQPLSSPESEELLDSLDAPLSTPSRARVLSEAGGNPLALLELPAALVERGLGASAHLTPLLPMSQRLEEAFGAQVSVLPAATRRLLLLLAAAGDHVGTAELAVWSLQLGLAPEDADAAVTSRLLHSSDGTVRFRHPLVRSAVYQGATLDERRHAHLALTATTTDPDRRAWHRAGAATGEDESVAGELEQAARRSLQRGAPGEAARAFSRAAALTAGSGGRARRLAEAAEAARLAGLVAESGALVEEALTLSPAPPVIALLVTTQTNMVLNTGWGGGSTADLLTLARGIAERTAGEAAEDPAARVGVLLSAAINVYQCGATDEVRRQVLDDLGDLGPRYDDLLWLLGMAVLDPVGQAPDLRRRLPGVLAQLPLDHPRTLIALGLAAEALQDLGTAATCWDLGVARLRLTGVTSDLVSALLFQGRMRVLVGQLDEGLASLQHAQRLAQDLGVPILEAHASAAAARVHAWRGTAGATSDAVGVSRRLLGRVDRTMVEADLLWAAGLAALGERRHGDAWIALRAMAVHPVTARCAVGDLTEVGVRAGQIDAVREVVEGHEGEVAVFGSPYLTMLTHRCRALLSRGARAAEHYTVSMEAGEASGAALELARTQLLYGEWLRRGRMIVSARRHLGDALDAFAAAGARPWAERAAEELAAAGVSSRPVRDATSDGRSALTAQERQITRLAATGLTNREIASHLHLSPRTVGAHLYNAYPKLGITTRRQLAEVFTE